MGLRSLFKRKRKKTKTASRSYVAAKINRLTNAWTTQNKSSDAEIYQTINILRARSRDIAINNDYGRRFLNLVKRNVVGPTGITLQSRVKWPGGAEDKLANDLVEAGWRLWCRKGSCTVCGQLSWIDTLKLVIESVAKDGELLIRMVKPWRGNNFGFALQLIEADCLDAELNKVLNNGHEVRMGVEFDEWRRPVAYWILKNHPNDYFYGQGYNRKQYERVPADEIIHPYIHERIGQSRGVPWLATSAYRLHQLGGFEEAELVASRAGASKMGFFTTPSGDDYAGQDEDDAEAPINEAEPGVFEQLPKGWSFESYDPNHPNTAFEAFCKAVLRGVASGLDVSYVTLANDLQGVSYSSIRQGALDERDAWKMLQIWLVENVVTPVFENWLEMALTTQGVPLPLKSFAKYNSPVWQPRGWAWVDPLKEMQANELAAKNLVKSMQQIAAEQGGDIYENIQALVVIRDLLDAEGIKIPAVHGFEHEVKKYEDGKQEDGEDG